MCKNKTLSKSGFTIPEALLQLVIFLLVLSFIPQIYNWYSKISNSFLGTQTISYELFLNEFRDDLIEMDEITTPELNVVELKMFDRDNTTNNQYFLYNYRYSNKRISKTYVGTNGMNIKLTGLKNATFQLANDKLLLKTEFKNHMRKERILVVPKKNE